MGKSGKNANSDRADGVSRNTDPMTKAMEAKDKGNNAFARASYKEAERWFTVALDNDPHNAVLYSNRSAALMMLGEPSRALSDANKAVQLRPDWGKAYYRKGIAHSFLEQHEAACATYFMAMGIEPENAEFRRLLQDSKEAVANYARSLLRWSRVVTFGSFPSPREGHAAAICQRKLLVFGGVTDRARVASMWQLDLDTLIWTRITGVGQVPPPMDGHSAVTVDDRYMFVFAGRYDVPAPRTDPFGSEIPKSEHEKESKGKRSVSMSNILFVLDIETMTWTQPDVTGDVPSARCYHASTLLGDEFWVFGGMVTGGVCADDVHVLNVRTLAWRRVNAKGKLPSSRWRHGAAVLPRTNALIGDIAGNELDEHLILIFGGLRGTPGPTPGELDSANRDSCEENCAKNDGHQAALLNDMFVLDPHTDTWTELSTKTVKGTPPAPRVGHTVTTIGRSVAVFGGLIDCDWATSDIHIFDGDLATWYSSKIPGIIPSPRGGHTAVLSGQTAFIVANQLRKQFCGEVLPISTTKSIKSSTFPSKLGIITTRQIKQKLSTEGIKGPQLVVFGGASPAKLRSRFKDIFALDLQSLANHESSFVSAPLGALKLPYFNSLSFSAHMPMNEELKFNPGNELAKRSPKRWGIKHIQSLCHRHIKYQVARDELRKEVWTHRWRRLWRENWRNRLIGGTEPESSENQKVEKEEVVADTDTYTTTIDVGRKRKHATEGESDDDGEQVDFHDDEMVCDRCAQGERVIASSQLLPAGKTEGNFETGDSWENEANPHTENRNEIEVGMRVPLPPLENEESTLQIKERPVALPLYGEAANVKPKVGDQRTQSSKETEKQFDFGEDLLKQLEVVANLPLSLDFSSQSLQSVSFDVDDCVDERVTVLEESAVEALSNLLSYMEMKSDQEREIENDVHDHRSSAIRFTHHVTRAIGRLIRACPPEPVTDVSINANSAQAFTGAWLRAMAKTLSLQQDRPSETPLFGPSVALTHESLELLAREAETHIRAQTRTHARSHGAKCISLWLQGSSRLDACGDFRNMHVDCDCSGGSSTMSMSDASSDALSDVHSDNGKPVSRHSARRHPSPISSSQLFSWKELPQGQSVVCSWRTVLHDANDRLQRRHVSSRSQKQRGGSSLPSDSPYAPKFAQIVPRSVRDKMLRVYNHELIDLIEKSCVHRRESLKNSISKLDRFYSVESHEDGSKSLYVDFAGIGPSASEYVRMGGHAVSLCSAVLNCKACRRQHGAVTEEESEKKLQDFHDKHPLLKQIAADAATGILSLVLLHLRVLCVDAVAHIGSSKSDKSRNKTRNSSPAANIARSLATKGHVSFNLDAFQDHHIVIFHIGSPQSETESSEAEVQEEDSVSVEETVSSEPELKKEEEVEEKAEQQNSRTKRKMRRRERRLESITSEGSSADPTLREIKPVVHNSEGEGEGWQGVVGRRQRVSVKIEADERTKESLCEFDGCRNKVFRRNMCRKHVRNGPRASQKPITLGEASRPPLPEKSRRRQPWKPSNSTPAVIPANPTISGRVPLWSALFDTDEDKQKPELEPEHISTVTSATVLSDAEGSELTPVKVQFEQTTPAVTTSEFILPLLGSAPGPVASDLNATAPAWMPPPIDIQQTQTDKTWSLFPASTLSPPLIPLPFLPTFDPDTNWNGLTDSEIPRPEVQMNTWPIHPSPNTDPLLPTNGLLEGDFEENEEVDVDSFVKMLQLDG